MRLLRIQKRKHTNLFFQFKELDPKENCVQVYIRTDDIDKLYQYLLNENIKINPNGYLQIKGWGQKEFSILDPDSNLLTFGQYIKKIKTASQRLFLILKKSSPNK